MHIAIAYLLLFMSQYHARISYGLLRTPRHCEWLRRGCSLILMRMKSDIGGIWWPTRFLFSLKFRLHLACLLADNIIIWVNSKIAMIFQAFYWYLIINASMLSGWASLHKYNLRRLVMRISRRTVDLVTDNCASSSRKWLFFLSMLVRHLFCTFYSSLSSLSIINIYLNNFKF